MNMKNPSHLARGVTSPKQGRSFGELLKEYPISNTQYPRMKEESPSVLVPRTPPLNRAGALWIDYGTSNYNNKRHKRLKGQQEYSTDNFTVQ